MTRLPATLSISRDDNDPNNPPTIPTEGGAVLDEIPADNPKDDDTYPGQQWVNHGDVPNARGGLTITVDADDGPMIATVNASPVEFQEYIEPADAMTPEIEGWDGLVLSRRNDADDASQILYAYTDIATLGGETFLQKYQGQLRLGVLTVSSSNAALAASGSFPTRTEADQVFTTAQAFAGTFDSVPGEFRCSLANGDCTVMANRTTGALILGASEFSFIPTDSGTIIGGGDGDYLYFGYWLHKPDASGAKHGFGLLSGGNDMFAVRATGDDPATSAED